MVSLMNYMAAVRASDVIEVPTGPRVSQGYENAANILPLIEGVTLIFLIAIGVLVAVILVLLLLNKLTDGQSGRNLDRRIQEDRTFIRDGYFNATSDILWEATRHGNGGQNKRY